MLQNIKCPSCGAEFELTESLQSQLLAKKADEIRLEAQKQAKQSAEKQLGELQNMLASQEKKLAEAQNAQAQLMKKTRELDDAKRELDLTVQKKVQAELEDVRQKALVQAQEGLKLKLAEKEMQMSSMQKKIDELKQKAEQGSQQAQGEALEIELEKILAAKFPYDDIEPVAKGVSGGDILQRVRNSYGKECGTILWELKRTKNWSEGWISKLKDDMRASKSDVAALVTFALPKDIDFFDIKDGVCVISPKVALPVAAMLRMPLIEAADAKLASEGIATKSEIMYQYLTGTKFRARVGAIVESFDAMKKDLDKEQRAIKAQWAKRETQIERVIDATVGMYGDLQGIAGASLHEIAGLELSALEAEL